MMSARHPSLVWWSILVRKYQVETLRLEFPPGGAPRFDLFRATKQITRSAAGLIQPK